MITSLLRMHDVPIVSPWIPLCPITPWFVAFLATRMRGQVAHTRPKKMATDSGYSNEQTLIFAGLGDSERTLDGLHRMTALGPQRVGKPI